MLVASPAASHCNHAFPTIFLQLFGLPSVLWGFFAEFLIATSDYYPLSIEFDPRFLLLLASFA